MSSFISGFRAVIAAAAAILVIEAAIFAVHPSTFVERSNYLDWNYGTPEIFHKAMIYRKLDLFAHAAPDIIQVGDSSGFHGVTPEIVMRHLGGLNYLNLSCCANTGYDGYYAIADFMFRRNPDIKALVLYVTLDAMPRTTLSGGDRVTGGADRIRGSFTNVWAYFSPPSMALRRQVTDAVYSRWGTLRPRETRFFQVGEVFTEMLTSIGEHRGWWAEHDPRLAGTKLDDFWRGICGDHGVRELEDSARNYIYDPILGRRPYARAYFQRFADLAAHHGARFVLIVQPYPCQRVEGDFLPARQADLKSVRESNENITYLPRTIFESWPTAMFTNLDHVRAVYDELTSDRAGRFLAEALGIADTSRVEKVRPGAPMAHAVLADQRSIWGPGVDGAANADGLSIQPSRTAAGSSAPVQLIERAGEGQHLITIALENIAPGAPYVVSTVVKPIQARGLRLEIVDAAAPADGRDVQCNLPGLVADRGADTLDAGLDVLPDGWLRCWLVPASTPARAVLNLAIVNEAGQRAYAGDGNSGILVKDVTVGPWRPPSLSAAGPQP